MWGSAKLSSRRGRVSVSIDAEVDVSISDVSSGDLIAELSERGDLPDKFPNGMELLPAGMFSETMSTLHELLARGRSGEALLLIERTLVPKWKAPTDADAAYKAAIKAVQS